MQRDADHSAPERHCPAARRVAIVVAELADETLVYDLTCHRAHCLNRAAALVWRLADGARSLAEIAEAAGAAVGQPMPAEAVEAALDDLARAGLVLPGQTTGAPRTSRRRVVHALVKAGIVAAAVPVVTSITVPTAVEAASQGGTGAPCTTGAQCAKGICANGICL
jgi:hypothetical protein